MPAANVTREPKRQEVRVYHKVPCHDPSLASLSNVLSSDVYQSDEPTILTIRLPYHIFKQGALGKLTTKALN